MHHEKSAAAKLFAKARPERGHDWLGKLYDTVRPEVREAWNKLPKVAPAFVANREKRTLRAARSGRR